MIVAVCLGLLVGAVVGGLGGGGGVLAVPVLLFALGLSAHDATTAGILVVGASAAAGVLARWRGRGVDVRTAAVFGLVGIPAAVGGTVLNRHVAPPVLLLAFALLTLLVAAVMLVDSRRSGDVRDQDAEAPAGGVAVLTRRWTGAILATVLACAAVVGFVTGFLGVGGGFLVVPALVVALRMPMPTAVGTTLLVIVLNSVSSLVSRAGHLHADWSVVGPFAVAAIAGTLLGKRVADGLPGDVLTKAFAALLVVVGVFVGAQGLLAW